MCILYAALAPAFLYQHLFAFLPDSWPVRVLALLLLVTDYFAVVSIGCLSVNMAKGHLLMILQNGTTLEMMKHFRKGSALRKGTRYVTAQKVALISVASTISDSSSLSLPSRSSGRD